MIWLVTITVYIVLLKFSHKDKRICSLLFHPTLKVHISRQEEEWHRLGWARWRSLFCFFFSVSPLETEDPPLAGRTSYCKLPAPFFL